MSAVSEGFKLKREFLMVEDMFSASSTSPLRELEFNLMILIVLRVSKTLFLGIARIARPFGTSDFEGFPNFVAGCLKSLQNQ